MHSTLNQLRELVPLRRLSRREAMRVAEAQAKRLLRLAGISGAPVPEAVISALPNLCIEPTTVPSVTAATKPLKGSAWAILVHGKLTRADRRWSMAHEFKHILDHPFETVLYARPQGGRDLAQDTCEYFAACLLMPARWVRLAWRMGMRDPRALARRFGVPPYAAVARLLQLGLIPLTSRHLTREA